MNRFRPLLYTSALSIAFLAALWGTVRFVAEEAGTAPASSAQSGDKEIRKLRDAVEGDPSLPNYRALAAALAGKLTTGKSPDQSLMFELIDTLRAMIRLDPTDKQALVTLANISYNHQAFAQAAENFEAYLKLAPDDLLSRSTYGSSLTFLGRFEEADKELRSVIEKTPQNFSAQASLAINYAAQGMEDEANAQIERIKTYSPDPDSLQKLQSFVASFLKARKEEEAEPKMAESDFEEVLRKHPILGPKIADIQREDSLLKVYVREFPMDQMPPFAKEKFFGNLREQAAKMSNSPSEILFIDQPSNKEMERISLAPND